RAAPASSRRAVGAWVERVGGRALTRRAERVARIELAQKSRGDVAAAVVTGLRSMGAMPAASPRERDPRRTQTGTLSVTPILPQFGAKPSNPWLRAAIVLAAALGGAASISWFATRWRT